MRDQGTDAQAFAFIEPDLIQIGYPLDAYKTGGKIKLVVD